MKQIFTIIPQLGSKDQLTINPATAARWSIGDGDCRVLRFGLQAVGIHVALSTELGPDELLLSQKVVESLRIPLAPRYLLVVRHGQIELGPYIGILACRTSKELDASVTALSSYLYDYAAIGGAILAFSLPDNEKNRSLYGYVFNPLTKAWEAGEFPYPKAIFQRIRTNAKWRDHLQSTLGDRVFNNYVFDKWEMYRWLSRLPRLEAHLPETSLLAGTSDILEFLDRHPTAYIKPVFGSQGIGIIKAEIKADRVVVQAMVGGELCEVECYTQQQLATTLADRLPAGRNILQQGIPLARIEDRIVDFRLIVVKDGGGRWLVPGMIGRYSKPKSITSNISGGGEAEPGEQTLSRIFQCSPREVYQLRSHMQDVAIAAAEGIEQAGVHCGNLGVDLGLDPDRNIWIIEINNRDPNHTIAIDAGNRQLFYQVKKLNLLYAKKLAGFMEE